MFTSLNQNPSPTVLLDVDSSEVN